MGRVIFPKRSGVAGPYIISARLISSTVMLQFRMKFVATMDLKLELLGQPISCWICLALFAFLTSSFEKNCLFSFTDCKKHVE